MNLILAILVALAFLLAVQFALRHRPAPDQPRARTRATTMARAEACEVLGLPEHASDADVIEAHRRLMQKVHPDKGGSAYLARQLNEAKRVLLQK